MDITISTDLDTASESILLIWCCDRGPWNLGGWNWDGLGLLVELANVVLVFGVGIQSERFIFFRVEIGVVMATYLMRVRVSISWKSNFDLLKDSIIAC